MVISVPYQLRSSQVAQEREKRDEERVHAGDLRRGRVTSRRNRPGPTDDREGRMSRRTTRVRKPRGRSRVGERFEAEVGAVAHGGHCVVRLPEPEARVVFVRHALPGERVVVEITEGTDGDRFWRGDAVSVVQASPDRVEPPVPLRRPRPAAAAATSSTSPLPAQRDLKTAVVREQLVRLGRLDPASSSSPASGSRPCRCPAGTTTACAGARDSGTRRPPTAVPRCASTAPTTWCPSTTA